MHRYGRASSWGWAGVGGRGGAACTGTKSGWPRAVHPEGARALIIRLNVDAEAVGASDPALPSTHKDLGQQKSVF